MPLGDGGEGTVDALCSRFEPVEVVDAFGRSRTVRLGFMADGTRVVEAAEAIPLDPSRLDVMAASSHGLGIWIRELEPGPLVVTVGGTATMDAGAGLLEVLGELPGPTRVLCDVTTRLYDAPRLFGPQKGATPEQVAELEARGARCYHIVGVEGEAWPPFPRAYRGGIPCCASLPFSPDDPIPILIAPLSGDGRLTRRGGD